MDRIETIRSMLAKTPDDVFLHYSLGMEYESRGLHAEAADAFSRCIALDKDYLPAYVEAGKSLRSAGRREEAVAMFKSALELASRKGEAHTADYIRQQIEGLK